MSKTTACLTALLLTGCAQQPSMSDIYMQSVDPYHQSGQYERDRAQCAYEAQASTASSPAHINLGRAVAQDTENAIRQGQVFNACMAARRSAFKP